MKKRTKHLEETTPARVAMIKAIKLTITGHIGLAKKELTKANRLLKKQYEKA
jgi:hypothetical protein